MGDVRKIVSNYVDACDTRVEVVEHGQVVTSQNFTAKDWKAANMAYGRLIMRGLHARIVATGLIESIISEAFGVIEDGYHVMPCPACGAVCMVKHTHEADVTGRRIIADHHGGDHAQCHPDGCTTDLAAEPLPRVRTREES